MWLVLLLIFVLIAGGCGTSSAEKDAKGTITIGLNNWPENIAVSNMWKILLEEKGYKVELSAMEKSPVWAGIAKGDLDIAPEVWLPQTDEPLYNEYKDQLELHEAWYEGTALGLVVPAYMDINSIEDLDKLGINTIVGIDPGASMMKLTKKLIKEYGLNYELIESSEPAMMSELTKAYKEKKPVVVTLWSPHWAFSEFDLKYLKDPKKIFGDQENIYFMTRKEFGKDYPEVLKWMNKWHMDDQSLGQLMATINKTNSPEEGAKQWIKENRNLTNQWFE
ncbi:glycine betaine ABC transporter substrate-binding protein [Desulforamulus reducens]|nr:glycine betaine ABC transporter substrate-binding protein [Desulforamulus reducens]